MDHLFISPEAARKGIYMDTLNNKQIVANCMIDLAFGYMQKYGAADGKFVLDCLESALPYFPKDNNISAYFVYSSLLARKLDSILKKNKITDLKDISKIPDAEQLYNELQRNEVVIKKMGYQDQPEELYQQMMKQQEFKGRKQQREGYNGKEKRSLFIND